MIWKTNGKAGGKGTGELTAFLDEASEIEGKFSFSGTVMVNGKLKGEIFSNDTLIIGEKGVVTASIRAGIVLVSGEVVGNILGGQRVELRTGDDRRLRRAHQPSGAHHALAVHPHVGDRLRRERVDHALQEVGRGVQRRMGEVDGHQVGQHPGRHPARLEAEDVRR
jgi:hypothetical protein